MRIVVLVKPVPDPASGAERLGPDGRLDQAAGPAVVNGNDEYALEAALKLVEAHGGEVTLVSMAPANAPETMRKALAMGAASGVHVTDPALEGSDTIHGPRPGRGTMASSSTSCWPASTPRTGCRASCRPASRPCDGCPTSRTRPGSSPTREPAASASTASARPGSTCSRPRCPRSSPARRPSASRATRRSKGIMAARSRTIDTRALGDLGVDGGCWRGRDDDRGRRLAAARGPRRHTGRARGSRGGRPAARGVPRRAPPGRGAG